MIGKYFLCNNKIEHSANYQKLETELVVYEVIRLFGGKPLFFGDHIDRLKHSLQIVEKNVDVNSIELLDNLLSLSKANEISAGNVMICIEFYKRSFVLTAYFIPHNYPTAVDYRIGVEVGFLDAERTNPEAKVINTKVREAANLKIAETGVYEVLLVDQQQQVHEGSRSNFFAVKNGELYTAPLNHVLKGVTLGKVIQIADELQVPVHFETIYKNRLPQFDALFLTGTSPQILPVKSIAAIPYDVNDPTMRIIMEKYDELIAAELNKKGTPDGHP